MRTVLTSLPLLALFAASVHADDGMTAGGSTSGTASVSGSVSASGSTTGTTTTTTTASSSSADASVDTSGSIGVRHGARPMPDVNAMSPRDMVSRSVGYTAQVQGALKTVEAMREKARQDQDIVRLTCLNDKMLQLKGEANVFDHARITFEDSVSNSDNIDVVRAAYVQLQIPGEHAQTLNEDARTCLGVLDLSAAEGTDTQHEEFPDDPTVGDPFEPEIEPPFCASPFR